jgi:hypothetical protein
MNIMKEFSQFIGHNDWGCADSNECFERTRQRYLFMYPCDFYHILP